MTVAALISLGREWSVRWSVYAGASGQIELCWQAEEADTTALLNALESAFGVRWPSGRVAVFDSPSYPDHGHVYGVVDPGDGTEAKVQVTMFERTRPEPRPALRLREV